MTEYSAHKSPAQATGVDPEIYPFQAAYQRYLELGWQVLTLPQLAKYPLPKGFTGRSGRVATEDDFKQWLKVGEFGPRANIAIRMPRTAFGVDVDQYEDKHGAEQLAELEKRYGALPATFRSTRRDPANPSGIRPFRIPEGWQTHGSLATDIETIQWFHRYAAVWPSVAPEFKDGTGPLFQYAWYDLSGSECAPPAVTDFPFLPKSWLEGLDESNPDFRLIGSRYRPSTFKGEPGQALRELSDLPSDDGFRSSGDWLNKVAWLDARDAKDLPDLISRMEVLDAKSDVPYLVGKGRKKFDATVTSAWESRQREWSKDHDSFQRMLAVNANKKAVVVQQPQASAPTASQTTTGGIVPSPDKPVKVARQCISDLWTIGTDTTLRSWRDQWMVWGGCDWREVETQTIKKNIQDRLEDAKFVRKGEKDDDYQVLDWDPSIGKINEVVGAIKNVTLLDASTEPNSWLDGRSASRMVAFQNGLLDIKTRKIYPASASYFNTTSLPYDYAETDAPPAEWLKFLASVWPDDQGAVSTLQEWFGYVLSGQTNFQKALMLIGPPRSGKGTIATVLTSLLGQRNVLGVGMSSFTSEFGLQEIVGKSLTVIGDGRAPSRDREMVVEKILNIVGEDVMTVNRKYRAPYNGKLATRLMLLSNEIPQLSDPSGALASRFIVLSFSESFLGREDLGLLDRLMKEIPAILRWSLDGLERLTERGRFIEPDSSVDTRDELDAVTARIRSFVADRCEFAPESRVVIQTLFDEYKAWCSNRGYAPGSIDTMGGQIMASNRGKIKKSRLTVNGRRVNCYVGLKLAGAKDE